MFKMIKLMLIDEIHMLGEDGRGATLEAVVTRMKVVQAATARDSGGDPLRFIGISATVPNVKDIAEWLGTAHAPAQCRTFGEEYRPVPLKVSVETYSYAGSSEWAFDSILDSKVAEVIHKYAQQDLLLSRFALLSTRETLMVVPSTPLRRWIGAPHQCHLEVGSKLALPLFVDVRLHIPMTHRNDRYNKFLKPTLVFCSTRKTCQRVLGKLKEKGGYVLGAEEKRKLMEVSRQINDRTLAVYVEYGLGFHHAGLDSADRLLIEKCFIDGVLPVITCTSTLAVGVNLPAYLVVVKGTGVYRDRKMVEYQHSEVVQMCGRAGRPQFETEGVAVIMTQPNNKARYENAATGQSEIESSFRTALVAHLNSEVVLGTITDVTSAIDWLKQTFYFIRVRAMALSRRQFFQKRSLTSR